MSNGAVVTSDTQTEDSNIVKDFDTIAPQSRVIKLGGETADVTVFSTRATLKLIELTNTKEKKAKLDSGENIEELVEVMALALKPSNPKMTADWLLDHVDMASLVEAFHYIIEPMVAKLKSKKLIPEDTKKEESVGETKNQ